VGVILAVAEHWRRAVKAWGAPALREWVAIRRRLVRRAMQLRAAPLGRTQEVLEGPTAEGVQGAMLRVVQDSAAQGEALR
jgi:hypothetical protein